MSDPRPPSPEAIALMQIWPDNDDWLTEQQLVAALRANGHDDAYLSVTGVARYAGRPLPALLRESRRRGWLFRNRHAPELMYKQTRRGSQAGEGQ